MRPKLIALLAVSAFALVGCSAGEPSAEPTATRTEDSNAHLLPPVPTVEEPGPEDMFINTLSTTFEGNESKIDKLVRYKMEESYYVDRGEEYCEQVEAGKKVEPMVDTELDNDYEIEHRIMISAQIFLCPTT